ncbi:hypothetical protein IKB17_02080 [bacterium]|nr:hypothetical protein [bacterium]
MHNISTNYGLTTNYLQPAFRGSKLRQIGNKIGESKFVEKLCDLELKMMELNMKMPAIKPEKSFKALGSRLKFDYYLNKLNYILTKFVLNHRLIELMTPKKYSGTPIQYNPQEFIDKGYEFVMKNKNNLEKLSLESHTKNNDYIKGMLKALKELGLVK